MVCLAAFLILALRAERYWPLWVAALQVIGTAGYFVKLADPDVIRRAYAFALAFWSYPMLLLIALGDLAAPAAAGPVRCRQILVELLGPFGPRAQDWADRLVKEFGSLAAVLAAGPDAQARDPRPRQSGVRHLGMVRDVMLHVAARRGR